MGSLITPIQPQAVMDEEVLTSMGLLSCSEGDDDAWVMEGEDITGERNAFDVFVDKDEDLYIYKLAFLLKKMFPQRNLN